MLNLIARRMIQLPLILAVIFVATFTLVWIVPGSPFDREDKAIDPIIRRNMEKTHHLEPHKPLQNMWNYVVRLTTKGDLGHSLIYTDQTVWDIIGRGLPKSAMIGAAALILALILGLGAGVIGALKPGSAWDLSSLGMALLGISMPTFVTGSVLLVVFAGLLNWFPVSGWGTPAHLVLPAITLSLAPAAYIARLVRLGLADVMNSDFVRTARAKGLPPRKVLFDHALKVAFLPVLSFLGPAAAATMTGSFVVEKVFAIPGIGTDFVDAVLNRDQFLILGLVLVYSTILIIFNLVVDIAYAWVDPRIDVAGGGN